MYQRLLEDTERRKHLKSYREMKANFQQQSQQSQKPLSISKNQSEVIYRRLSGYEKLKNEKIEDKKRMINIEKEMEYMKFQKSNVS